MSRRKISQGITKIAVKGFKSIAEECAIDIRPLTILAGANSSGKSSIMQPLLMLKQTLEAPYESGTVCCLMVRTFSLLKYHNFYPPYPMGKKQIVFRLGLRLYEL